MHWGSTSLITFWATIFHIDGPFGGILSSVAVGVECAGLPHLDDVALGCRVLVRSGRKICGGAVQGEELVPTFGRVDTPVVADAQGVDAGFGHLDANGFAGGRAEDEFSA